MALGGADGSGTPCVILAQKWGVGYNHRLLAVSRKECSLSQDKLLSQPSQVLIILPPHWEEGKFCRKEQLGQGRQQVF